MAHGPALGLAAVLSHLERFGGDGPLEGSSGIQGLQRMHARGVVHGDVHAGNVAFLTRNRRRKLGFIDFGLAAFASADKPALQYPPMKFGHCLWSHWNIEGYRFAYRDDVFKMLLTGAHLLHGLPWMRRCQALGKDPAAMAAWKRSGNLFSVPGQPESLGVLQPLPAPVLADLTRAVDLVRAVEDVDALPPYDAIIAALSAASAGL